MAALIKSANISAKVESMVANLIASRLPCAFNSYLARLHDGRMKIQIMRHHGRPEDADGDVEHARIGDDPGSME